MTEPKNKGGRPLTTLNDEQIKEVAELAESGLNCEQIADYLKLSERTFRNLKERDSAVFTAYKKGKAAGVKKATNLLWSKMMDGDTTSIIFYLKTQARWSEKNNLNVTSEDGSMSPKDFKIVFEETIARDANPN
jgi:hypothetical protein